MLIYLGVILVGSTGLGLAFDLVWTAEIVAGHHHHGHTWWAVGSAWVLGVLFVGFFVQDVRGWLKTKALEGVPESSKIEVDVGGMTCGGCVSRLERALSEVEGVESVAVTLEPGKAMVVGKVSSQIIEEAIIQTGFDVGRPSTES